VCDNITDEIYRKLERDRSIIYVCKICRDEVEKIKKECRREASVLLVTECHLVVTWKDSCGSNVGCLLALLIIIAGGYVS